MSPVDMTVAAGKAGLKQIEAHPTTSSLAAIICVVAMFWTGNVGKDSESATAIKDMGNKVVVAVDALRETLTKELKDIRDDVRDLKSGQVRLGDRIGTLERMQGGTR